MLNHVNIGNDFLSRTTVAKHIKPESRNGTMLDFLHMPLVPAYRRQSQPVLCEFKTSLVYIVCSRPARDFRETVSQENIKEMGQ